MAYSKEQVKQAKETIVELIYQGRSLKNILDNEENLPSRPIIYQWLNEVHKDYDKSFLNNYLRAREDSADIDADKVEELNQEIREKKLDPSEARVIADNLKWIAGKKKPKKYGDRIQQDTTGVVKHDFSAMSLDEVKKAIEAEKKKHD